MLNLDSIINQNNKEQNKKLSLIPDHMYRILVVLDQEKQTNCLI